MDETVQKGAAGETATRECECGENPERHAQQVATIATRSESRMATSSSGVNCHICYRMTR